MTMRYAHLAPAHQLAAVEQIVAQPAAPAERSATTSATSQQAEVPGDGVNVTQATSIV